MVIKILKDDIKALFTSLILVWLSTQMGQIQDTTNKGTSWNTEVQRVLFLLDLDVGIRILSFLYEFAFDSFKFHIVVNDIVLGIFVFWFEIFEFELDFELDPKNV